MKERQRQAVLAVLVPLAAACASPRAEGAKLADVRTIDETHIAVHWLDGEVFHTDDGEGQEEMKTHKSATPDLLIRYEPGLSLPAAARPDSFTITSSNDASYKAGAAPAAVMRKTKVNGVPNVWPEPPFTLEHTIYLRLPRPLKEGGSYTVSFSPSLGSDRASQAFRFDSAKSESQAIKVSLSGTSSSLPSVKSADLYMWLGDGGARDYSRFVGRPVYAIDQKSGAKSEVGRVTFWKPNVKDYGGRFFTQSPVWNIDYTALKTPGRYRLSIPGIGCSREFEVRPKAFLAPFEMSVKGYYYMRIGEDTSMSPPPRQPRYIPGKDPVGFTVYRTTYGPFHPDWAKKGGDQWDNKDWSMYKEPGSPTNPNAYGGHSDAGDWDRHMGHISNVYDMLLPYVMSGGKLSSDRCGIKESGDGLPDIIQEAQNEVDFWLRLRDGDGNYSCGLNNPTPDNKTMYQAASHPVMAWANAANAAMLADSWRLAGRKDLCDRYRTAAEEAWSRAKDQALDVRIDVGDGFVRGRDLKMLAAASLYNITGDRKYEDVVAAESAANTPGMRIENGDKGCQTWPTALYLMCAKYRWQPVHHAEVIEKMKAAVISEAVSRNVEPSESRPSRRASSEDHSWFPTGQHVQVAIIAHSVAENKEVKARLLKALVLEAEYGLGRNPLGVILMSGWGDRGVEDIYTSGQHDGIKGTAPGQTPYMNAETWWPGYMSDPQWMAGKGYPAWSQWPYGEAIWKNRSSYANVEFTPQQTMRGKTALLGYLAGLELK